ncbi:unnamed protein product [Timema podura]|uniref:Uncharacterized protein n=1 Tax=Timema podura TaxID=61482 RepID=A0ABN7PBW6_TIMPD|nr:unnamed protein product [Timema podura]
MSLWILSLQT